MEDNVVGSIVKGVEEGRCGSHGTASENELFKSHHSQIIECAISKYTLTYEYLPSP